MFPGSFALANYLESLLADNAHGRMKSRFVQTPKNQIMPTVAGSAARDQDSAMPAHAVKLRCCLLTGFLPSRQDQQQLAGSVREVRAQAATIQNLATQIAKKVEHDAPVRRIWRSATRRQARGPEAYGRFQRQRQPA